MKAWRNSGGFPLLETFNAPGKVYHFMINDDETRLVTTGDKRGRRSEIAVFSISSGRRMDDGEMYHSDSTFSGDFSEEDEDMFATGSDDGTIAFWNVRTFKNIGKYDVREFWRENYDYSESDLAIHSIDFNPKGNELAYCVRTLNLENHNNVGVIYPNGTIRHEMHI